MERDDNEGTCAFDKLFEENVSHILEKIFLTLDYDSLMACRKVSKNWNQELSSDRYEEKLKVMLIVKRENEAKLRKLITEGNLQKVSRVLKNGVSPNFGIETPLHLAASYARVGVVRVLLDAGAKPDVADLHGRTPLHIASNKGQPDVVTVLIKGGADPNKADENGKTPLRYAIMAFKCSLSVVPPRLVARSRQQSMLVKVLLEAGADVSKADNFGSTPLHRAAELGNVDMVRILVDAGAEPSKSDEKGRTPMQLAFTSLQSAARGPPPAWSEVNISYYTNVIKALLARGAKLNEVDHTSLLWAAVHDHKDIVQIFIDGGAAAQPNEEDQTVLHVAAKRSNTDLVKVLLDGGADPNRANEEGDTPFFFAAAAGKKEVVQLLLDSGADPNKANEGGHTPLHLAAMCEEHTDVVQLLLDRGADPKKSNENGLTLLDVAEICSPEDVVNLLKRKVWNMMSSRMEKRRRICHYYSTEFCAICL